MWHKKHTIGFKAVRRWYIRGWGVSKRVVCLTLTIYILKLYLKAICWWSLIEIEKLRGSYKKLYDITCVIFALNCTVVVYKGLWCIEAGRVPHIVYFYFEAISKAICWWRLIETEGASATRYLSPLLGKTELSIMSYRKHVSSSGYLSLTIEIRQEMYLKVFSIILQRS